ncbi:MAG TPA: tetratricopeptide repeat protein [Pirellulales bacterium]|nr:tetratricopeptide repeat protein [Pirellulales bacterium]
MSARPYLVSAAIAAFCSVGTAAERDWQGETVMVKETAIPQVGAKKFRWNDIPMPATVEKVNGQWLWLGVAWVKQDEVLLLDDAPAYYTELLNRGTHDNWAYALRGLSWLTKREYDSAVKDLTEALRLEPFNSTYFCLRGKARHAKRDFSRAVADFTEAIRLNPSNLIAYNDRGVCFNAQDEFAKALDQFNEVLRVDPVNALAFANRGATWYDLEEYKKSLADMNRAIELSPKMAFAYVNRGRWYMKHGDYPEAKADYDRAIELAPREWSAYNGLARIYATAPEFEFHLRDGKQALEMAKRACELSHWDEWVCVASLAAAYAELGDFASAVQWQTKAMAMSQPAKLRDQKDNEKRLELYKSGKAYYEVVAPPAESPPEAADDLK